MPEPAYFETSTFLEILGNTVNTADIRALIDELQRSKTRIYTSILTVQEVSILSFRKGQTERDMYALVAQFARIYSMDRAIAIGAARMEASLRDLFKEGDADKLEAKHRRRWDCIHLATAQVLGCRDFYSFDKHFPTRAKQVDIGGLKILRPVPTQPGMFSRLSPTLLSIVKPPKSER